MKKLVFLLAAVILATACLPKLPDLPKIVVLQEVQLPVVAQENELWQPENYQGQPVLVVFMGSWCPWCKRTMPAVDALAQKYAGQVEVVGAFMDAAPGPVRDVAQEHNFNTKALYNAGELAETLGVNGLPHTMLFDKKHRIVKTWEGYHKDMEEAVGAEIDKLLK